MTPTSRYATLVIACGAVPMLLPGCGSSTEEPPCREGTALAADGHCYADTPATVYEALLALDDCEPVSLDGNIDYEKGCIGEGCLGMTFEQLNTAFDEYAPCETVASTSVECTWSLGVVSGFEDDDANLVPDSDSSSTWFRIVDPAAGASRKGTGVGANPRCAVDEFGAPDYVSLHLNEQETSIRYLAYTALGAYFYDLIDHDGAEQSDGVLEEIVLVEP